MDGILFMATSASFFWQSLFCTVYLQHEDFQMIETGLKVAAVMERSGAGEHRRVPGHVTSWRLVLDGCSISKE